MSGNDFLTFIMDLRVKDWKEVSPANAGVRMMLRGLLLPVMRGVLFLCRGSLYVGGMLDNNLPDPSVSYSHFWGNKEGMGFTGEFVASQSFDFPSVYVRKHKLTKAKSAGLDRQGMAFRQQILLQVKEVCLDLVLLNQQKNLLDTRLRNAEQLSAFYATRLEKGNANILETNKIDLELLNARTEARMNETSRIAKLQELATLNGGIAIEFTDTVYALQNH